jgi:NADH-quinone oxidoreductase subunit J
MNVVFYLSALVALICTVLVISSSHAVHALLYLIVSLFAVALIFFVLGAPFAAALEVIVYAGAIMVLFVFVVMLLNLGDADREQERTWLSPKSWVGPSGLALILFGELVYVLSLGTGLCVQAAEVTPQQVGIALFGPYLLGVELASMLLLAGLVGAYHLGRSVQSSPTRPREEA